MVAQWVGRLDSEQAVETADRKELRTVAYLVVHSD